MCCNELLGKGSNASFNTSTATINKLNYLNYHVNIPHFKVLYVPNQESLCFHTSLIMHCWQTPPHFIYH